VRRKLADHDERRRELDELREEAADLASASKLPSNAEAELRETVGASRRRNATWSSSRRGATRSGRASARGLLGELSSLKAFGNCTAEDADKLVGMAAEIRRLSEQDSRARNTVFELRDSLAGQGHAPERLQFLSSRFKTLPEAKQKVLRGQFDMQLQYQTEVAELEKTRTDSTETLREVDCDAQRARSPAGC
jgi:anti-sigma factor RsiW